MSPEEVEEQLKWKDRKGTEAEKGIRLEAVCAQPFVLLSYGAEHGIIPFLSGLFPKNQLVVPPVTIFLTLTLRRVG